MGWAGDAQAKPGAGADHDRTGRARHAGFHRLFRPIRDRQAEAGRNRRRRGRERPVGSLVGQLAKMAGAKAIGIAGGADKCRYVVEDLHFDDCIDHRAPDFAAKLAAACPKGIDVYFENVGGAIWQAVLPLLNTYARVPVCGLISQYSAAGPPADRTSCPQPCAQVLTKSLTLRGFINTEFVAEHYADFLKTVGGGIADGRIHYREDITDGIENAPAAFMGLLQGKNFGKALVRVSR